MIWLCPLFFILAFVQGWIMRQVGMVRLWGGMTFRPLEVVYVVWGIFWVGSALEFLGLFTYWNMVLLFAVSLPGITWGFTKPKTTVLRRLQQLRDDMQQLSDGIINGRFINLFR